MLKLVLGFCYGLATAAVILALVAFFDKEPSPITFYVENDTENILKSISFSAEYGPIMTCSFAKVHYKNCIIKSFYTGDTSFEVEAHLESGEVLNGNIGYTFLGSIHTVLISHLKPLPVK